MVIAVFLEQVKVGIYFVNKSGNHCKKKPIRGTGGKGRGTGKRDEKEGRE
jgi:hypothetical protein